MESKYCICTCMQILTVDFVLINQKSLSSTLLLTKEHMSVFVVKSIVIQMNGLDYGSIHSIKYRVWD